MTRAPTFTCRKPGVALINNAPMVFAATCSNATRGPVRSHNFEPREPQQPSVKALITSRRPRMGVSKAMTMLTAAKAPSFDTVEGHVSSHESIEVEPVWLFDAVEFKVSLRGRVVLRMTSLSADRAVELRTRIGLFQGSSSHDWTLRRSIQLLGTPSQSVTLEHVEISQLRKSRRSQDSLQSVLHVLVKFTLHLLAVFYLLTHQAKSNIGHCGRFDTYYIDSSSSA